MRGSVWIASYVLLWVAVLVLSIAVVALLRQIGVLHARLHPLGVHFGGEGPLLDSVAPHGSTFGYEAHDLTLVAFTSPTCEVCATLRPSLDTLARQYREVAVRVVDLDDDTRGTFGSFNVQSTPYVVAVDRTGLVRGRGVANSLEQLEELVAESTARTDGSEPGAGDGPVAHRHGGNGR